MSNDNEPVLVVLTPIGDREEALTAGADALVSRRSSFADSRNVLVIAAATLVTTGIALIILGWFGVSRATFVEEQMPFVVSGGLLGVALAIVGGLVYFAHWLAILVRETHELREQSQAHSVARANETVEILAALQSIRDALDAKEGQDAASGSPRRQRAVRRTSSRG